jgi:hypothetical protein
LISWFVDAPVLEKFEDFSLSLKIIQRNETSACKMSWSEDDELAGALTATTLWDEQADYRGLYGIQIGHGKIVVWENVAYGFQIHG